MRGSLLEVDEDVDDAEDIGEQESEDWTGDGEFEETDFLDEDEELWNEDNLDDFELILFPFLLIGKCLLLGCTGVSLTSIGAQLFPVPATGMAIISCAWFSKPAVRI